MENNVKRMPFATNDLYLSSALLAYGAKLSRIDRSNPRRQKFIFDPKLESVWIKTGNTVTLLVEPTLSDVEAHFISETLMFPPTYPNEVKRIKSAIHSIWLPEVTEK